MKTFARQFAQKPTLEKNTKKSPKTKRTAKKKTTAKKTHFYRRFIHKKSLCWAGKIGFTLLCVFALYGVYLDGKIRSKMDGEVWELPAEIYGNIPTLAINQNLTWQQVLQLLRDYGYRQTRFLAQPGDVKIEPQQITLLRRAFPFPNQVEDERILRLRFVQNRLRFIDDLTHSRQVDSFQLAPALLTLLQSENEDRLALPLNRFPRLLIDGLLATEDRKFFQHDGVSLLGVARAVMANIRAGHKVQGGSTITQQLVKNLFLSNERSFVRKFNEAYMAILLDARYSKNRILQTYLNEVYLGQLGSEQIHGFALASLFYFDKPIAELSLDQMALLIGLVKGASFYNPWTHPARALERRNIVLKIMQENQIISPQLLAKLQQRPLGVQQKGRIRLAQKYPAFVQQLRHELHYQLGAKDLRSLSGTRIFTTLDPFRQQAAEKAVEQGVAQLQRHKKFKLQSAMVVADYHTGAVRALVGDADPNFAGFNRAIDARRQIGSLVKPSVYLSAFNQPDHYALNTLLANQPLRLRTSNGLWSPQNYNHQFSEPVTAITAFTNSMNIPTVNLGLSVGLKKVIQTQQAMGWDQVNIPAVPAMLLGAYAISPFEVTKLYQTLANNGSRLPLHTLNSITDQDGNTLYEYTEQATQAVPPQAAFITLFAMQSVVKNGTGKSLQRHFSGLNLAGKTGTTNQARDTWFVGIDGQNVSTVWLGRDDNGSTHLTGSTGALYIYERYLQQGGIMPLRLKEPSHIGWAGIGVDSRWQCGADYVLPYWKTETVDPCGRKATSRWKFWE